MKKTFVNPEMNISLFDMENVVTTSGKNIDEAREALKDAGVAASGFTTIDWVN